MDAADEYGAETEEQFVAFMKAVVSDEEHQELLARTLTVARDTAMRDKRRALGRALASAASDTGTKVDAEQAVMTAAPPALAPDLAGRVGWPCSGTRPLFKVACGYGLRRAGAETAMPGHSRFRHTRRSSADASPLRPLLQGDEGLAAAAAQRADGSGPAARRCCDVLALRPARSHNISGGLRAD
jgi:hypothetical protein